MFTRYEMVIGVPPFYSENQSRMFHLIRKGKLVWPGDVKVSDPAKDLITRV
jgi:serum/glucocorticoid-regulated kinase 2